jgi:hypothetical protein
MSTVELALTGPLCASAILTTAEVSAALPRG